MNDTTEVARSVHLLLCAEERTVATAESLTGGRLSARFTDVPGVSATFLGGVIAYATAVKRHLLRVPDSVIDGPGVISAACAEAMAIGVRALTGADYALATTGVAGPEPQEGRPAGTVFIGIDGPGGATHLSLRLAGDRTAIQEQTCEAALRELGRLLRREDTDVG